jgi:halogenation protein CepH
LVLVGDAACFVDPVFSSGVHLATYSALLAARSINTCLGNHLDESKSFSEFEARYKREYKYFYEFLTAFYELDQDTEGYYWKARSLISGDKSAEDAFLTLVGGDASGELQNAVAVASNTRSEIAKSLFPFALTKFTQNKVDDGNFKQTATEFWEELVAEGTQLQIRGTCSKNTQHERPLFAGGLVPSKDGLHWANPTSPARKSFAGSTK